MDSLKDLEKYVDDALSYFISKLHEMQGNEIDLGVWLQLFAFGKRSLRQHLLPKTDFPRRDR